MNEKHYTGIPHEDRRIHLELVAMGYTECSEEHGPSACARLLKQVGELLTWMRWKGEIAVSGHRIGAHVTRHMESVQTA
ncbi:MAG: hypothetical protein GYB41_03545 [Oceanospirillales bacterium]|uniref:Uncharacterized protein n=1 Tax=Marinobacterium halophilum TaxID=267374 RepID=A0A2P8EQP2_9GAMM|nr:hypothetical protein [Marinobacterium halophilum]MBR9827712.1 hypothetical protein [Oceanospirillales bacterium]PSL11792.1 hypothetical protein CLV44_1229 [Marinobacterium halophilum]